MRSFSSNEASALVDNVKIRLNADLEEFPSEVITVFGQRLRLLNDSGGWWQDLNFEHVGYSAKKFHWASRFHADDYIEWIIRSWALERIQLCTDIQSLVEIASRLETLEILGDDPIQVEEQMFDWLHQIALIEASLNREKAFVGARLLYRWCFEEDLPGFSEFRLMDLESILFNRNSTKHFVSMRDVRDGPYTRVELSMIDAELLKNPSVSSRQRALYLLGRDWGVRPIQMALLRPEDFGRDQLGPFIMVPSVKGIRRSKLRRAKGNLVKRYIADDTADAIEVQIAAVPGQSKAVVDRLKKLCKDMSLDKHEFVMPLFPVLSRSDERLKRLCTDSSLAQYVLHADSIQLSRSMRELSWQLRLKTSRACEMDGEEKFLRITPYRLRRTKGTGMVLSGATPEEVAEALDHQGIGSVDHYFRYNRDLHNFINNVHAASPEIADAVRMWSGRISISDSETKDALSINGLGKCTRNSPCPYHPTVTCYACGNFRPLKSGDHQSALISIVEFQRKVAGSSTGPIGQQLEAAIFGAKAVILAMKAEDGLDHL